MLKNIFICGLLLLRVVSFAQEVTPQAAFQKDTIAVGELVPFSVWITYPKDLDVIYPDSLFDFSPFELENKRYFLTESDSLNSYDSVVYYLSTFEIDSIQYLQVPLYLVDELDSTILITGPDSIILRHVVTEIPDSVALKVNTSYIEVPLQFNYPYLIIGLSIGFIILVVIILVFGKSFKRQLKLYRLRKRHKKFSIQFDSILSQTTIEPEPTLLFWKAYMEQLLRLPYTKLTTQEIKSIIANEHLFKALKVIDKMIYGHEDSNELQTSLEVLKNYSQSSFEAKTEEIKHG